MSTAFRVAIVVAAVAVVLALLLGPAWRGNFYRSWLRPRLLTFGIIIALLAVGTYVYRVINAIAKH